MQLLSGNIFKVSLIVLSVGACFAIDNHEGYYKDLFMDGGVNLTHRTALPSSDTLELDMEYLATSDSSQQAEIMVISDNDENGALLYPDGEPRFRVIYTNGGSATNHGNSLGEIGRERIRTFYANGGSYTGSCAGAFICSISYLSSGTYTPYYHIWPGRTQSTGLLDTYTGHFIVEDSPLLDYFDFGGDMYIDHIYHNGGCYAREELDFPPETEILLRYDYSSAGMHEKASCWAYKSIIEEGRIVVIGSHPESISSGERLELMMAILQYAIAGNGVPHVKAVLENDVARVMDKTTADDDPSYTMIGDKQYHHFRISIPTGASSLTVALDGDDAFDMNLYLNFGYYAFGSSALYWDNSIGATKTIVVPEPEAGVWYIGVECATTVVTTLRSWGYEYTGNTAVLNGVAYSITAGWDTSTVEIADNLPIENFKLGYNSPNPFNNQTAIDFDIAENGNVRIDIFDSRGNLVKTLFDEYKYAGHYEVLWDATDMLDNNVQSGIYFYSIQSKDFSKVRKAVLLR